MADDKGYKDTKEFTCTGCGKKIILTKFASQKTCRCDDCKNNNIPVNPNIVAEALKVNPPKEKKKSDGGATKTLPCIKCGTMTEVSKFMSAQKVLCDNCKGTSTSRNVNIQVDKSKIGEVKLAPIEEYEVNNGVIANKRLREVACPACGHKYMKPLMIIDWSQFGLVIEYQCKECLAVMEISEQCRRPLKMHNPSTRFDYTGTQIMGLGVSMRDSSRIANAMCVLIEKLKKLNINVEDMLDSDIADKLPPYRFENDKPVEKGFVIPKEDEWIHTVHSAYELLKNADGDTIEIDSNSAKAIADKLNKLLQGGQENE